MSHNAYKFYVGIDVSKGTLDIAISNSASFFQFSNNEDGLRNLIKVLPAKKNNPINLASPSLLTVSSSPYFVR